MFVGQETKKTEERETVSVVNHLYTQLCFVLKYISDYGVLVNWKSDKQKQLLGFREVDNRIHSRFRFTETGRVVSYNPCLHNIDKIDRDIFIAGDNKVLLYYDLAQAEISVAVCMARDELLINLINSKQDVYLYILSKIYKKEQRDIKQLRETVKNLILGYLYGMSIERVVEICNINNLYTEKLLAFMDSLIRWKDDIECRMKNLIQYPTSRYKRVSNKNTVVNHLVQGTAADVMHYIVVELYRMLDTRIDNISFLLYDGIILEVNRDRKEIIDTIINNILQDINKIPIFKWLDVKLMMRCLEGKNWLFSNKEV